MNKISLLLNAISLIILELKVNGELGISKEFVTAIVDNIEVKKKFVLVDEVDEVKELKVLLNSLFDLESTDLDETLIIDELKIILREDEYMFNVAVKKIKCCETDEKIKEKILSIRKLLSVHYGKVKIENVIRKYYNTITRNSDTIKSLDTFRQSLLTEVTELASIDGDGDPSITNEIDLSDSESALLTIDKSKDDGTDGNKWRTGFQGLNKMVSYINSGSFVIVGALQHNYKTSMSMSLFMQLARFNKPKIKDKNKKPLFLWVSLEDDSTLNVRFMYEYLKNSNLEDPSDYDKRDSKYILDYIVSNLSKTGFSIKLLRVNPSDWSYMGLFNKILQYEKEYELKVIGIDYLAKIPTTGCNRNGATGSDILDLFTRVRNFFSSRETICITPHQLSSDADRLSRNVDATDFLKWIHGKGYYQKSTQIGQEMDLEIFVHKAVVNDVAYLCVQRGKHKGAPIIADKDKFFMMKFDNLYPMREDVDGEPKYFSKISGGGDDEFDF